MNGLLRCALLGLLPCCAAIAQAPAPGGLGNFSKMSVEAGQAVINFKTGAIDRLTGGVRIRLKSSDPAAPELPIQAGTMAFAYAEGGGQPSKIVMNGDVLVKHPQATVRAGHADYNLDNETVVFTENPVVVLEGGGEVKGKKITIDMKEGTTNIEGMSASELDLNAMTAPGGGAANDPNHIGAGLIGDWNAFAAVLKKEAGESGPNPTRRILTHAGSKNQIATLAGASVELIVQNRNMVLDGFNKAIATPGLYDAAAWEGRALSPEAQQLLAKEKRDAAEEARLNRLLIEAAYPGMIQ
jgi:lipopolysaccharide export system protein LptA